LHIITPENTPIGKVHIQFLYDFALIQAFVTTVYHLRLQYIAVKMEFLEDFNRPPYIVAENWRNPNYSTGSIKELE
jgi:hypothetical protein